MPDRLILKITKFQLSTPTHFSIVVQSMPHMSNRVKPWRCEWLLLVTKNIVLRRILHTQKANNLKIKSVIIHLNSLHGLEVRWSFSYDWCFIRNRPIHWKVFSCDYVTFMLKSSVFMSLWPSGRLSAWSDSDNGVARSSVFCSGLS